MFLSNGSIVYAFGVVIFALNIYGVVTQTADPPRSTFLEFFPQEVDVTTSADVARALELQVWKHQEGDRPVKRYYEKYDTPFYNKPRPEKFVI